MDTQSVPPVPHSSFTGEAPTGRRQPGPCQAADGSARPWLGAVGSLPARPSATSSHSSPITGPCFTGYFLLCLPLGVTREPPQKGPSSSAEAEASGENPPVPPASPGTCAPALALGGALLLGGHPGSKPGPRASVGTCQAGLGGQSTGTDPAEPTPLPARGAAEGHRRAPCPPTAILSRDGLFCRHGGLSPPTSADRVW